MTFTEIVNNIASRLNLTSDAAIARIGEHVNQRYKRVTASIGLITSRRTIVDVTVLASDTNLPDVSVSGIEKVVRIAVTKDTHVIASNSVANPTVVTTTAAHGLTTGDTIVVSNSNSTPTIDGTRVVTVTGTTTFTVPVNVTVGGTAGTFTIPTGGVRVLRQSSYDDIANEPTRSGEPHAFAVKSMSSGQVTITLDAFPDSGAFTLTIEAYNSLSTLSGSTEPSFPEDFHDILVWGALADEQFKMEKPQLAAISEAYFERRLSDLRMFIAKTAYQDIYQGKNSLWNRHPFANRGLLEE